MSTTTEQRGAMTDFLDDWFQDAFDESGRIEQHAVASLSDFARQQDALLAGAVAALEGVLTNEPHWNNAEQGWWCGGCGNYHERTNGPVDKLSPMQAASLVKHPEWCVVLKARTVLTRIKEEQR